MSTWGQLNGRKRKQFLALWGRLCVYCHRPVRLSKGRGREQRTAARRGRPIVTVDHVVPRAAGGTDDLRNLAPACGDCNGAKGSDRLPAEVERKLLAKAEEVAYAYALWELAEREKRERAVRIGRRAVSARKSRQWALLGRVPGKG